MKHLVIKRLEFPAKAFYFNSQMERTVFLTNTEQRLENMTKLFRRECGIKNVYIFR